MWQCPYELARRGELGLHARNLAGISDDGVLEARLPRFGRPDVAVELDGRLDLAVVVEDEAFAIHDLEDNFVNVHRMGVGRRVVEHQPRYHQRLGSR